jgi:hypothetical protein
LAARGRGRDRRSREAARSLSCMDACNPLLQAHLTWARDEHEGRGISTSLTPISGHLTSPLRARPRVDPSGLGHAATFTRRLRDPPVSKRRQLVWFLHGEGSFSGYPPFPVPVARDREKRRKGKGYEIERRDIPFLARLLRRRRSVARFSCQKRRQSCRGVNATGRVVGGAVVARARAVRGTDHGRVAFTP